MQAAAPTCFLHHYTTLSNFVINASHPAHTHTHHQHHDPAAPDLRRPRNEVPAGASPGSGMWPAFCSACSCRTHPEEGCAPKPRPLGCVAAPTPCKRRRPCMQQWLQQLQPAQPGCCIQWEIISCRYLKIHNTATTTLHAHNLGRAGDEVAAEEASCGQQSAPPAADTP